MAACSGMETTAPSNMAALRQAVAPTSAADPNAEPGVDTDGDFVGDTEDNCYTVSNPDQANIDGDADGDACDPDQASDIDADGIPDMNDACPLDAANDADGDGLCGDVDACPVDATNDVDGDGVCGSVDNCPLVANDQTDTDGDGLGDACDTPPAPTTDEVIQDLRDAIRDLADARVLNPALAAKLSAAVDDIVTKLAAASPEYAVKAIRLFIASVEALVRFGRLTAAQGASLIEPAMDLIEIVS